LKLFESLLFQILFLNFVCFFKTKATLMEFHIAPQRDAAIAQQAQWVKQCISEMMGGAEVR
jgi:hypothetical protein